MMKNPTFYFVFFYIVTLGSVGLSIINHMSPMLTGEFGMTAATAAMVVSVGALFNGFGRLTCGMIFDRIGSVATTRFLATTNVGVLVMLYLAYKAGAVPVMIALICASLFLFGGNSSTIPSITRGLYGEKHFSSNYSVICLNSVFSPIPTSIVGMMQVRTGSYEYMFYLLGACALAAAACAWSARENKTV